MVFKSILLKNLGEQWVDFLEEIVESKVLEGVYQKLQAEIRYPKEILPEPKDVFRAFRMTPPDNVKVVILGMDPYPTLGVPTGLSFGIREGTKIPPTLKVISQEVKNCTGSPITNFTLEHWAEQGCLMLNTALTVERGNYGSHLDIWMPFTEKLIKTLNEKRNLIYVFWGKDALYYEQLVNPMDNTIFKTCHPLYERYNPAKADFLDSNIFNEINRCLEEKSMSTIKW